ncbi:MAG: thioredoxin-dependent thiol peroxidase [Myxococcota bacterium]
MSLTVGSSAPAFSLQDDTDQLRTLADFAGKTLVLYFYPKDDTPGCTREAQDFRDLAEQFSGSNAVIVGVSKDSVASHQKFKTKYGLNFSLLSDPTGGMIEAYGVWKEKNMYGKKSMGIERTTVVIDPSGVVKQVFPKVKVDGHAGKVLACVRS